MKRTYNLFKYFSILCLCDSYGGLCCIVLKTLHCWKVQNYCRFTRRRPKLQRRNIYRLLQHIERLLSVKEQLRTNSSSNNNRRHNSSSSNKFNMQHMATTPVVELLETFLIRSTARNLNRRRLSNNMRIHISIISISNNRNKCKWRSLLTIWPCQGILSNNKRSR